MTLPTLATLEHDGHGFRTDARHAGDELHIAFDGEVGLDGIDALATILRALHLEAQHLGSREVVVDLTKLEFLNSSGVKHFVTWLQSASTLQSAVAYQIKLLSNPLIPWQKRTLEILRCFSRQLVTIEPAPI